MLEVVDGGVDQFRAVVEDLDPRAVIGQKLHGPGKAFVGGAVHRRFPVAVGGVDLDAELEQPVQGRAHQEAGDGESAGDDADVTFEGHS